MSKSATATAPKNPTSQPPTKPSAWARGPPSSTSSSVTPRSQSPSSANATQPSTPTHSRKPSALGGPAVSVPRSIQPTQRTAAGLSFGSIAEPPAPLSSSPASAPPLSSDAANVKSFGSIPAANGIPTKPTISKPPSKPDPPVAPSPSPTPSAKPKIDVRSFFRNNTASPSASSPTTSSAPEGSPAQRPAAIPPPQPSQNGYYLPRSGGPPPISAGISSTSTTPRSPPYSRTLSNGTGTNRNGPPNSAGLGPSSPRMGNLQIPHPQQHQMSSHGVTNPQHMQPQHGGVPVQTWGPIYQYPPPFPVHDPAHPYVSPFWTPNVGHPSAMHAPPQQPQPPHTPAPHPVASPSRPPPPPLQGAPPPSGPTATPSTATSSPYPHPQPYSYPQSPPPPGTPQTPAGRLNMQAPAFVMPAKRSSAAVSIRHPESGEPVDLAAVASPVTGPSDGSMSRTAGSAGLGHQRKTTEIRIESEEARTERLEAQRAKEQEKMEQELVAKRHRETEEKIRRRKEEEERKRLEEEEKARKERERKEQLEREEKERERIRKEAEEKERIRKEEEEKERIRKEEEEKEKGRIRKEEEEKERIRLEEEERKRKEEEAKAKELARKAEEEERPKKEAEDEKLTEFTGSPAPSLVTPVPLSRSASPLPVEQPKLKRPIPGPLDLSATSKPGLPPSLPSALATARVIDNLDRIQYPVGIMSPKPELNTGASNGRFRYDRDFLLQFMSICKDKPDSLPALDAIGLEAVGDQASMGRRSSRGAMPPPSTSISRANVSLGGVLPSKATNMAGFNQMGQFGTPTGPKGTSEERFAASQQLGRSVSASGAPGGLAFTNRGIPMARTASQGGSTPAQSSSLNPTSGRTRSQRGSAKRSDKGAINQIPERDRMINTVGPNNGPFEPVEPLRASENRWTPMNVGRRPAPVDIDSSEVVERKVKSLLNKLTMEKFDSISDQIVAWANKSEKEKDGRTLIQVIRLVFEKATDEAAWSEMYARLCRKMMEQISQKVQDDGIRGPEGKPIAGGQLFRKYLLNRCQEDFERGWSVKEASAKAAESKAADDKAVKDAVEKAEAAGKGTGEEVLYSEEYYAAQRAKRRGLGLVKFIGELFKLQMLTERIMHECIKKQLGNVENPEEEEIESLCKLLSTVGRQLDTDKARSHMDVYFQRMKELSKSPNITSRMQYMLLDVLELRERGWVSRKEQSAPTTIAAVHEQAAKDHAKAQIEKDQSVRNLNRDAMSRGGSRRGEHRGQYGGQQTGPDGWTSVAPPRPTPTAGDLSQFGKINKPASGTMTFGPGSVFAAKKDAKGRDTSLSRTSSTSNMFAMLNTEAAAEPPPPSKSSRAASRKPSADFTQTGVSEAAPQRKKLALLPRTKPVPADTKVEEESAAPSEASDDGEEPSLSADEAKAKIKEDLKELWAVRNLEEADSYLPALPVAFRSLFIEKLVGDTIERKESDALFVAKFLSRVSENGTCSEASMGEGFAPLMEFLEDIVIDAPSAYKIMAILLRASKLPREKVEALAKTIAVEGKPLTPPSEKLLKEYEELESS